MSKNSFSKVDHSAIKVNQIAIIGLNILSFVFDAPWIVAFVAAVMLIGVFRKTPGFGFVYKYGLRPLKLVKPDILNDNPEPHQFAQLLGAAFMVAGSLSLILGWSVLGWIFVWLVIALAALNAFGGFCVGCAIYYWLGKLNLAGFTKNPPPGTTPGKRPGG